jgi:hypothetical protein
MTQHAFSTHEIELYSGAAFDPSAPDASAIDLGSIAQALSCVCRYGGHCEYFSDAEHAVLVANKLRKINAPLSIQFAGLHHDNHEGIDGFGDIQAPAKSLLPPDYHERVSRIEEAICLAIGWLDGLPLWTVDQLHDPLVKRADNWAKRFEAKHLMRSQGEGWLPDNGESMPPIPTDDDDMIRCLSPVEAKEAFLDFHFMLVGDHVRMHGKGEH